MEAKSKYCGMINGCMFCDFLLCPGHSQEVDADGNRGAGDRADPDRSDGRDHSDSYGR